MARSRFNPEGPHILVATVQNLVPTREAAPCICVPLATSIVTISIYILPLSFVQMLEVCRSFCFNDYTLQIYVFWNVTPCSSAHTHLLPINIVSHIIRLVLMIAAVRTSNVTPVTLIHNVFVRVLREMRQKMYLERGINWNSKVC